MGRRPAADAEWFASEVTTHLDAVYRYFLRRSAVQDAEDLAAEVFEIAWRRRADVPVDWVLPWLYRTAGFVLANHRRRVRALPLQLADEPIDDDHAHRIAERDRLSRALAELSERDRDILLMHAWEGLTGDELAAALGISRSGAQAALSRARARLRLVWVPIVQDPTSR
ncbi:MAG TPA: sigma-70 family RNA polymerase sigma factor [Microbacterium sp.]|jgi:RNA polymerase sigma-70 factor (ECF subfamily)|nr:sigma-70 family RNA polymerase sigma factor [Microbacterium sp.]